MSNFVRDKHIEFARLRFRDRVDKTLSVLNVGRDFHPANSLWLDKAPDFEKSSSQYLTAGDDQLNLEEGFTVVMWVKPETSSAGDQYPLSVWNETSDKRQFRMRYDASNGQVNFNTSESGTAQDTNIDEADIGTTLAIGEWSFLAGWQVPGVKVGLQINEYHGENLDTSGLVTLSDGDAELRVGSDADDTNFLDGGICRIGIWKRVLTTAERMQLYNGGYGLPYRELTGSLRGGLLSYWDLTEGQDLYRDYHGRNHLRSYAGTASTPFDISGNFSQTNVTVTQSVDKVRSPFAQATVQPDLVSVSEVSPAFHLISRNHSVTSGNSYRFQIVVRANPENPQRFMGLTLLTSFPSLSNTIVDIIEGRILSLGAGANSSSLIPLDLSGEWYLLTLESTASATGTGAFQVYLTDPVTGHAAHDGAGGEGVYIAYWNITDVTTNNIPQIDGLGNAPIYPLMTGTPRLDFEIGPFLGRQNDSTIECLALTEVEELKDNLLNFLKSNDIFENRIDFFFTDIAQNARLQTDQLESVCRASMLIDGYQYNQTDRTVRINCSDRFFANKDITEQVTSINFPNAAKTSLGLTIPIVWGQPHSLDDQAHLINFTTLYSQGDLGMIVIAPWVDIVTNNPSTALGRAEGILALAQTKNSGVTVQGAVTYFAYNRFTPPGSDSWVSFAMATTEASRVFFGDDDELNDTNYPQSTAFSVDDFLNYGLISSESGILTSIRALLEDEGLAGFTEDDGQVKVQVWRGKLNDGGSDYTLIELLSEFSVPLNDAAFTQLSPTEVMVALDAPVVLDASLIYFVGTAVLLDDGSANQLFMHNNVSGSESVYYGNNGKRGEIVTLTTHTQAQSADGIWSESSDETDGDGAEYAQKKLKAYWDSGARNSETIKWQELQIKVEMMGYLNQRGDIHGPSDFDVANLLETPQAVISSILNTPSPVPVNANIFEPSLDVGNRLQKEEHSIQVSIESKITASELIAEICEHSRLTFHKTRFGSCRTEYPRNFDQNDATIITSKEFAGEIQVLDFNEGPRDEVINKIKILFGQDKLGREADLAVRAETGSDAFRQLFKIEEDEAPNDDELYNTISRGDQAEDSVLRYSEREFFRQFRHYDTVKPVSETGRYIFDQFHDRHRQFVVRLPRRKFSKLFLFQSIELWLDATTARALEGTENESVRNWDHLDWSDEDATDGNITGGLPLTMYVDGVLQKMWVASIVYGTIWGIADEGPFIDVLVKTRFPTREYTPLGSLEKEADV